MGERRLACIAKAVRRRRPMAQEICCGAGQKSEMEEKQDGREMREKKRDKGEDGKEPQRKRFLLTSRCVEAQGVCVIKCFLLLFSFSFLIY